jgi:hypothetical protein
MLRLRALTVVVFAMWLTACSAAATPGETSTAGVGEQVSDGGQVVVTVGWPGPAGGAVFDLKLDTHSINLDAVDRGDQVEGAAWAAPSGGHHRQGRLTFVVGPEFFASTRWIELVLFNVGQLPERRLRWETGPAL